MPADALAFPSGTGATPAPSGRKETDMADVFLTKDDWAALVAAAARARRGLRAFLSAEQAAHLTQRGYMAPSPRDPGQFVITAEGKIAAQNYERSLR